ncbi:MAG: AAA family ATPase [Clostridiales bacterium]|nr:AAA family ATPase [Clostridiales bacterium]
MQYFKYECTPLRNDIPSPFSDREFNMAVCEKTENFNETIKRKAYCFVSQMRTGSCTVGVLVKDKINILKTVKDFMKAIEIDHKGGTLTETTYFAFERMLTNADRTDYIEDRERVLEGFGIYDMLSIHRGGFDLVEGTIREHSKEEIYKDAAKLLSSEALIEELDRIYTPKKNKKVTGIPVQYMVITDDAEERNETIKALIRSLYVNERISSQRISRVVFWPHTRSNMAILKSLFKSCEGGTVVIKFSSPDNDESDIERGDLQIIEDVCEIVNHFLGSVQMIFCLPRECTKAKDMFYANLGMASIIEIKEGHAYDERAREFLDGLAKNSGIRPDKKLYAGLKEKEGYLAADLRKIFADWYTTKMKTSVYPQYKEVATVKSALKDAKPRGSAFDELQGLIGLPEAKSVIQKALDYYKAQKLFADKGMPSDHPAMHMVFKGNPGTAKTTVARLFARIMKENNLLSKGHLIECGRSDLVGKYVGWTAPLVQQKFKEAAGGVLFIDEAYSLVDGRNGLYGDEAINTIVQEMENHREDMVVIFAGYPDKMEQFINRNPGLRSRIAFHVPFNDYDTDSLCKIAAHIADGKGLKLTDETVDKLATIFEVAKTQEDFGNGRYVRNLIEQARMAQASRLVAMDYDAVTKDDIATIRPEDVVPPTEVKTIKKFGFSA